MAEPRLEVKGPNSSRAEDPAVLRPGFAYKVEDPILLGPPNSGSGEVFQVLWCGSGCCLGRTRRAGCGDRRHDPCPDDIVPELVRLQDVNGSPRSSVGRGPAFTICGPLVEIDPARSAPPQRGQDRKPSLVEVVDECRDVGRASSEHRRDPQ